MGTGDYITLIAACDPTPTHELLLELMDLTGTARTPDIPHEAAKVFYERRCAAAQRKNKNVPVSDTKYSIGGTHDGKAQI